MGTGRRNGTTGASHKLDLSPFRPRVEQPRRCTPLPAVQASRPPRQWRTSPSARRRRCRTNTLPGKARRRAPAVQVRQTTARPAGRRRSSRPSWAGIGEVRRLTRRSSSRRRPAGPRCDAARVRGRPWRNSDRVPPNRSRRSATNRPRVRQLANEIATDVPIAKPSESWRRATSEHRPCPPSGPRGRTGQNRDRHRRRQNRLTPRPRHRRPRRPAGPGRT